jgi:hypothetical protein
MKTSTDKHLGQSMEFVLLLIGSTLGLLLLIAFQTRTL